jgi:protein involved in polysaccharide export with SLBB domain
MTDRPLVRVALLAALALGGCRTTDDARVLQVLNQRGFGRPTQDANRQYYIGINDTIILDDSMHPEYRGQQEVVRMDGVITLADVGEVYVNGLSPDEATQAVRQAYSRLVNDTSGITVRVTGMQSKRYYVSGVAPNRPRSVPFRGDELLLDALIRANLDVTIVATEHILVIRGDPENPLVIECNYEDIVERGLTRDNIQIRENDIIWLTPSPIGWLTYGVFILTAPIKPLTDLVFGVNNVIAVSDSFGEGTVGYGGKGGFNQFNN